MALVSTCANRISCVHDNKDDKSHQSDDAKPRARDRCYDMIRFNHNLQNWTQTTQKGMKFLCVPGWKRNLGSFELLRHALNIPNSKNALFFSAIGGKTHKMTLIVNQFVGNRVIKIPKFLVWNACPKRAVSWHLFS